MAFRTGKIIKLLLATALYYGKIFKTKAYER